MPPCPEAGLRRNRIPPSGTGGLPPPAAAAILIGRGEALPQRAFWRAWNERINRVPYVREGVRWDRGYLAGVHRGEQA
jgi:hypothetical protein